MIFETLARSTPSTSAVRYSSRLVAWLALLAASAASQTGRWSGAIKIPEGEIAIVVELLEDADGWKGAIDIPEGAQRAPRRPESRRQDRLLCSCEGAWRTVVSRTV